MYPGVHWKGIISFKKYIAFNVDSHLMISFHFIQFQVRIIALICRDTIHLLRGCISFEKLLDK